MKNEDILNIIELTKNPSYRLLADFLVEQAEQRALDAIVSTGDDRERKRDAAAGYLEAMRFTADSVEKTLRHRLTPGDQNA